MSRAYASHPTDPIATAGAPHIDAADLTATYEDVFDVVEEQRGKLAAYGSMQALCSLAIARVQLLERELGRLVGRDTTGAPASERLAVREDAAALLNPRESSPRRRHRTRSPLPPLVRDERRARAELYERSGNVVTLPDRTVVPFRSFRPSLRSENAPHRPRA